MSSTTYALDGCRIRITAPTLVGRSHGYLWFPGLVPLASGDIMALATTYADEHTDKPSYRAFFSPDQGRSWPDAADTDVGGWAHVRLADGDDLLLPYYLHPTDAGLCNAAGRVRSGQRRIERHERGVTVTGWPRPTRPFTPRFNLAGFVFNHNAIRGGDGHLTTLYGWFEGQSRMSLVLAASSDGLNWRVVSIIADHDCPLPGKDGPSEAALCRLPDGRILCVFRLGGWVDCGQTFSSDEGSTWSPAATSAMKSVKPALATLPSGMLLGSSGRPGLHLWLDRAGTAQTWQHLDLQQHHNAHVHDEPITWTDQMGGNRTSSYTELLPIGPASALCIYDRIPCGWKPIPAGSGETNSLWVVRIDVTA